MSLVDRAGLVPVILNVYEGGLALLLESLQMECSLTHTSKLYSPVNRTKLSGQNNLGYFYNRVIKMALFLIICIFTSAEF